MQMDMIKKPGVAIIISDKTDFKTRAITREKESHYYIIFKGVAQQEDITLVNMYALNIGATKYINKILEDFKKEINSNTVIVGDINTPLSTINRSSRQKNQQG